MGIFNFLSSNIKKHEKVDYIVIDLETSGLNSRTAEIIEMSGIKVSGNQVIETYSTLVRPQNPLNADSLKVNKITPKMLEKERPIEKCVPEFLKFIGDNTLLGYNISSFDIPILKRVSQSLGLDFQNDYIDILYLARKKMSFLPSRSLSVVASYFAIDTSSAHRSLDDCIITKECYEKLLAFEPPVEKHKAPKQYHVQYNSQTKALQQLDALLLGIIADDVLTDDEVQFLNNWLINNKELQGNFPYDRVATIVNDALEDGVLEKEELDEMLVLFKEYTDPTSSKSSEPIVISGKSICITGFFKHGDKSEIENFIIQHGGSIKSSVSSKTDYVIIGSLGSADYEYGNYGAKVKKAMELQDKGSEIKIILEDDLFASI